MAFVMSAGTAGLYSFLAPAGLADLLPSLYLSLASVVAFFMGVLYIVSIFYFAGDINYLLPLPLPVRTIIAAKLLVTLVWLYVFLFVLLFVPLFTYGLISGSGLFYFLKLLPVYLLLPVLPLGLAAGLVMLVLRFAPLARNKDRFNFIASLLILILALGFVLTSQSASGLARLDLVRLFNQGAGQLTRITSLIFPLLPWAIGALADKWQSVWHLFALLAGSVFGLFLILLLAQVLYLPAVTSLSSANLKNRLGQSKLERLAGRTSLVWLSYLKKELRILLRTPVFFMNNVLMSLLWPVFFLMPALASGLGEQLGNLPDQVRQLLFSADSKAGTYALLLVFFTACIMTATNGIAASSISREGKVFYLIKILPLSSFYQVLCKLAVGALFGLISILLPLVPMLVFLRPPFWFGLALFLVIPGAVVLPNLSGVFFDLLWPKLKWDNEQAAVKQNINLFYNMLAATLLAALLAGLPLLLALSFAGTMAWLAGTSALLIILLGLVLKRKLPAYLAAID